MNKIQRHLSKILTVVCILLVAALVITLLKASSFQNKITGLERELALKVAKISKVQDEFGTEVSARATCQAELQPLKDELTALNSKIESFAVQAASCEQLRRKLKK